jgi:hypothetical protein
LRVYENPTKSDKSSAFSLDSSAEYTFIKVAALFRASLAQIPHLNLFNRIIPHLKIGTGRRSVFLEGVETHLFQHRIEIRTP